MTTVKQLVGFVVLVAGCGASTTSTPSSTPPTQGMNSTAAEEVSSPAEPRGSMLTRQDHVCEAARSNEPDLLRRWIQVFPVQQGGAVVVFTGSFAEPGQVESTLESNGIAGYEHFSCDSEVVVWIPGIECPGPVAMLTENVENNTTMRDLETVCFSVDEVRMRIEMECREGVLSGDFCP
jgi:hypothetical protein